MYAKAKVALVAVAAALLVGAASPIKLTGSDAATFTVPLSGHSEPTFAQDPSLSGDLDGTGSVKLTVDLETRQICYEFTLSDVATPLMAHIHKGPELSNGPSVVTLFTGPGADLDNCLLWTEKWLTQIVADPSAFYVNLYTTEFPDGALRGQLLG
jgi:hypothetical protein